MRTPLRRQPSSVRLVRFQPSADTHFYQLIQDPIAPFSGGFIQLFALMSFSWVQHNQILPWEKCFYSGDRLQAEISLLADGFRHPHAVKDVVTGLRLIHSSFGAPFEDQPVSFFAKYQSDQPDASKSSFDAIEQYLLVADLPDALLFWFFC